MSQLRFDYTNVLSTAVGPEHGLEESELAGMQAASQAAVAAVQARRGSDLRWMDLPHAEESLREIQAFAKAREGQFDNIVVLGIGGSALGNTALHTALNHPYHNVVPSDGQPRLIVLDNVDPDLVGAFVERFDPSRCLFNVISKSGGTAETMSQFLLFRQALIECLGEEQAKQHLVVTTDAEQGVLREIVTREGYASFVVPDGVGGRFSVLSPVGLVSSALVGIDIEKLLAGAAAMDTRCRESDLLENPAALHAAVQYLLHTKKRKVMAVTMSYSHRLRDMADWYAQLLAESIGKRVDRSGNEVFAGPTPIRAVGVTDQHSQVQLYAEGPFDKWFTFLSVDEPERSVTLPHAYPDLEGVAYLGGRTLGELFSAERDGTRIALTEAGRPNATLSFDKIDAHSVGQMIAMLEMSVAFMGEHYDVNAFDQPGVEAGKIAAYALMGRAGFEERRAEIEGATRGVVRTL